MKTYPRVTRAMLSTPWAMLKTKLADVEAFLARVNLEGPLTPEAVAERYGSSEARPLIKVGSVAVIPVQGVISQKINMVDNLSGPGGTSTEVLTNQVRSAIDDKSVGSILLDIDSPGGSVFGVQELYDVIVSARAEKRVVACVNSLAASAAYWLACAANEMVVTPGGQVGSVGVYMMHADVSKKMEMEGVKTTFVQAGAFKTEGNPFEPLSAEARAAIQEQVDAYYGMFVKAVAGGRGVAQSAVRDGFGQGRMVMAAEAVKMGMADRVATLDATLGRLLMKGARAGGDKTARMTTRDLEALLRDGAGLSHSKAKKLASLAYEPDHASGTEDEEPAPATSTDGMDQETREALREFIAVMQD